MQGFLQELIVGNVFAFLLIFMRFGTALMIMPGIGDSFVSPTIRLFFALSLSFVLTPFLSTHLPVMPSATGMMLALLVTEALIGIFIGTVMRILVSALDTAGSIVSMQTGLSNAILFNPATESQGSIISAIYSSLGVTLLLVTDMHHQMLGTVVDSYRLFPATGSLPDTGSMTQVITHMVLIAFKVGVQLTIPFIVVGMLMQIGFGVLGRLIPQIQVFFLAMPLQIFLGFVILIMTLSAGVMYWLRGYETVLIETLSPG
jgi:flagellar biosynthesis protein FliR